MSARNTRENKKLRKLSRALRKGRVATYIDIVQYLKDRRYAQTTGEAVRIVRAGRVKVDSHTIKSRLVPASQRNSIFILDA
jgi:alkylated DNA nucleotide flippase Atl1